MKTLMRPVTEKLIEKEEDTSTTEKDNPNEKVIETKKKLRKMRRQPIFFHKKIFLKHAPVRGEALQLVKNIMFPFCTISLSIFKKHFICNLLG